MPRASIRNDDNGIGGFVEDLPKLLFILFAVALFVTSTVTVYGAYNRYNENTMMIDNLNGFTSEILAWDEISPDRDGIIINSRLVSLSPDDWKAEFPPDVKYFEYQVQVLDRSLYVADTGERYDHGPISSQERPVGTDIYSKTVPVILLDSDGNYRASHLIISIWRGNA